MLRRNSMSAGIYHLPRHPAGTLACRIEYYWVSLRFIFCLSDTSCLFLVCIFIFPGWRSKTHLLSSDREQQGHCRTSEDIFPSLRKEVMDFCCCLKYLSVSLCVWCLNVMCEEYLTRSNLLNPKKRTFDHELLHSIRPFSSERAVITGILGVQSGLFIQGKMFACTSRLSNRNCHWLMVFVGFQSNLTSLSKTSHSVYYVSVDLCFVNWGDWS